MTTLTQEVKAALSELAFSPRKRFGQNFMVDRRALDAVATASDISASDHVIEIGPGLGFLTEILLKKAGRVTAVEMDRDLAKRLAEHFEDAKLTVIQKDILKFSPSKIDAGGSRLKVIGNIPYNITSPILEWLILNRSHISDATLTVQQEVAQRLTATPGSKIWGSLSVFVQFYAQVTYAARIGRSSFWPSPKVDSAIVRLHFPERPTVRVGDEKLFFDIVRSAFQKRRKTVLNALIRSGDERFAKTRLEEALNRSGIQPKRRPETLSLAEWALLSENVGGADSRVI